MSRELMVLVMAVFMTQGVARGLTVQADLSQDVSKMMGRGEESLSKTA